MKETRTQPTRTHSKLVLLAYLGVGAIGPTGALGKTGGEMGSPLDSHQRVHGLPRRT